MKPRIEDITPEIKSAVGTYLLAKAYAQTMREAVNLIHREILVECPIFADDTERRGNHKGKQILSSGQLYLCSNEALCDDFYAESNTRLRKVGLKPDAMPDDHCPALVAENLERLAAQSLIESAQVVFHGLTVQKLLCAGLDKYNQYIDLLCRLVVSMPDFKAPILRG
jgi:hypothetical protein